MKPLLLSFLLAAAAVMASADDKISLNGKWQIHNNIAGNESEQDCTFTQKDSDLTGSCSGQNGTVNISGKINAKKVTWTYKSEYNGGPITLTYEGAINSATDISGFVRVEEYGADGQFTATQSK